MNNQDNIIPKILLIVLIMVAVYFIVKQTNKNQKRGECFNSTSRQELLNNNISNENVERFANEENNVSMGSLPIDNISEENKSEFSVAANDNSNHFMQAEVNYKPDIEKKLRNKNQAKENEYKSASYVANRRGYDDTTDWKKEFSNLVNQRDNSKFIPIEESNDLHPYAEEVDPLAPKKGSTEDLFDTSKLLPTEKRDDWFEVMEEPISVKNRHLINVSRNIAVNTIGSSLRNPTYDLRPAPACPKFVPGPWNQTTIEPDINGKSIF